MNVTCGIDRTHGRTKGHDVKLFETMDKAVGYYKNFYEFDDMDDYYLICKGSNHWQMVEPTNHHNVYCDLIVKKIQ